VDDYFHQRRCGNIDLSLVESSFAEDLLKGRGNTHMLCLCLSYLSYEIFSSFNVLTETTTTTDLDYLIQEKEEEPVDGNNRQEI
jgi:hypothetical protein